MKRLLSVVAVLIIPLAITTHAAATQTKQIIYEAPPRPPVVVRIEARIDWTQERIKQEIDTQAKKYGVSSSLMWDIIKCESTGSTTIQSYHVRNGVREKSFGLVQIHLPAHPNISYEEAISPQFAIEFLAKNVGRNPHMWSCYDMVR